MDEMKTRKRPGSPESARAAGYAIQISGTLHGRWSSWFGDVALVIEEQRDHAHLTILYCSPMDQARLRGLLNKIWDLNLDLIAVQRLSPGAAPLGRTIDEGGSEAEMEDGDV